MRQRRLAMCQTALGVNITMCFSLYDLSCCLDPWIGNWRSVKSWIFFFFSVLMWKIECYSAPKSFGLPYLHMMIDEDYKNVGFFAIESQSEDESMRDRSSDQSCAHRWMFATICSLHPATLKCLSILYNCPSWVIQLYASHPIIHSAYESLNPISPDCVLLFTFLLVARKLFFIILQWTEEIEFI